jgi:hypothetical protein
VNLMDDYQVKVRLNLYRQLVMSGFLLLKCLALKQPFMEVLMVIGNVVECCWWFELVGGK